jgi:hypothetical protein
MMSSMMWVHSVLSSCHTTLSQQHGAVLSGHTDTVAVSGEWSIGPALHCSHTVDVCPHVLQTHDGLDVRRIGNMRACVENMRT